MSARIPSPRRSRLAPLALGLGASLLSGCGAAGGAKSEAFSSDWQNDQGRGIARVEERLRAVPRRPKTPAAVGLEKGALVGATLPNGKPWRVRDAFESAPVIAGDVVVARAGKKIVGIETASGRVLFRVSAHGLELGGAGDDGRFTIVSLVSTSGGAGRVLGVDRSGSVVLDLATSGPVGHPAALGGVAFVPWGGQFVSAIDIESGDSLGRLLVRDLVSQSLDFGTDLYFGEKALLRFDEKIAFAASNQATRFELHPRELPGKPIWLGNGLEPSSVDPTARTKIRVYALPEAGGGRIGLANGAYAATYFRVVYGLAESDGRLLFTDATGGDVIGGAAAASGFVFCDGLGRIRTYDATGGTGSELELGGRLSACSVEASSLHVEKGKSRGSLAEQVNQALHDLDPDMATAENFLIAEIGKIEDPIVTRVLIALAQNVRIPAAERTLARTLLAKRKNGVEHMLEALGRHYDFISGDQPPPVGPLADALAALRERRSAPLLARHLNDPANSIDDVSHAAVALESLATTAELGELKTFFALYRATADEPLLVRAVVAVAGALVRVGGPEGHALVERASADPLTQPEVQQGLAELLAPKAGAEEKKGSDKTDAAPPPPLPSKP